ncbi:MAG: All-trans-nonaprenyl-diphosphate synthase (geranyl-diphosphate specific) [Bacteroidetes bacterium ADurb.Bin416]|nr:MAG: All-trans-nonaprenyl-diphosphate synthase (geranyl-diphosphate specific) [Bacteroidetes bacterium ADurb.Bin416]
MLDLIRKPIAAAFKDYEKAFDEAIKTETYLLHQVLKYVRTQKGKEIRPHLVLLSAGLSGDVTPESIKAAVSLELLHTASLMHDDVVDNTYRRRSGFSVKALWNNKAAILVGDYYLSKSAFISSGICQGRISELLAALGCELSEGEMMQLNNEKQLIIDEPTYLEVIQKKTARTFAFCTQAGAISANAPADQEEILRAFGEYLGMVFQIKDDIFDYFAQNKIGKPTSNDLREGKMTLPLIFALQTSEKALAKPILNTIRNRDFTHEKLQQINQFVIKSGGIDYAEKRMTDFKDLALEALSGFPDNAYKQALKVAVDYFMKRTF